MSGHESTVVIDTRNQSPVFIRVMISFGVAIAIHLTQAPLFVGDVVSTGLSLNAGGSTTRPDAGLSMPSSEPAPTGFAAPLSVLFAALPVWGVAVVVGILIIIVTTLAGLGIYFRHPRTVRSRCLKRISRAEELRETDPNAALQDFDVAIDALTRLRRRGHRPKRVTTRDKYDKKGSEPPKPPSLDQEANELLGQAYVGSAIILLQNGQLANALPRLRHAHDLGSLQPDEITPFLAPAYLDHGDQSEAAVWYYIHYLKVPAEDVDVEIAARMASWLETHARIGAQTDESEYVPKIQANLSLATIPGPGIRVVVEQGNDIGTQVEIIGSVTIGSASGNAIRLDDQSASQNHALIDMDEEGGVRVSDQDSETGTFVQGTRIEAPVQLSDGDQIQCGASVLRFYSRPRPLGIELPWPHYNLGMGYFNGQDYRRAIYEFTKALNLGVDVDADADLHWYLGRCHEARGKWENALQEYSAAIAINESHHGAQHSKGVLLLASIDDESVDATQGPRGGLEESISHLDRATRLAGDRADYLYDLARAYTLDGRAEESIGALQSAIAIEPGVLEYHTLLAREARRSGNYPLARKAATAALDIDFENIEANWILGDSAFLEGDYSTAVERLEYVRAMEASGPRQQFSSSPVFACRLGRSLYETGKYQTASQVLAAAAKHSRDALFYVGRCHSRTGHFDSAARIFYRTISTFGEEPEARYFLAASLANAGGDENCKKALKVISLLEKHDNWAVRSLCFSGKLLAKMGRLDEATKRYELAQHMCADDPEVSFEVGRLACIRGDFSAAESAFRSALEGSPDDLRALVWLGRVLFAQKKHAVAAPFCERALACTPPPELSVEETTALLFDANYFLGRLALLQKDDAAAVAYFEKAREDGCSNQRLVYDLALAYAYAGRYDDAVANLSSLALEVGDDTVIRFNLAVVSCRMATNQFQQRRYEQAIQLFEQSLESFRTLGCNDQIAEVSNALAETRFRFGMVSLFSKKNKLSRATTEFERAATVRTDDARVLYFLGVAYFAQGEYVKAEAQFRALDNNGQRDPRGISALALTLEQAGNHADAENEWVRFSKMASDGSSTVDGTLGLAGFYARRENWTRASGLLRDLLLEECTADHPHYAQICKLAVSFLNLAGETDAAEQIIQQHLHGVSPGSVDAYLGAMCARRRRWNEAMSHLSHAITNGSPTDAVLELYDHVVRLVAAQEVLEERLDEAVRILSGIKEKCGKMSARSQQFLSAAQAALLLGNVGDEASEGAVAAYETAYKRQPGNPKILRNFAVLSHRLGIAYEEQGNVRKADKHWKRACQLWKAITDDANGFWPSYLETYNQNRHRRDRIRMDDLDTVRKRLVQRLCDVHVEFARAYADHIRLKDTRRHVTYAGMLAGDTSYRKEMSRALIEKAAEIRRGGDNAKSLSVFELAYEINPEDRDTREAYATAIFNRGTDCLNNDDLDGAERSYKKAKQVAPDFLGDDTARKMWAALHLRRAFKKIEAGNQHAANSCYENAKRVMPDLEESSELRPLAAQFYLAKGNHEAGMGNRWGAKSNIERALALDPTLMFKVNGLPEACRALGINTSVTDLLAGMLGRRPT